jgi:DNA-binding CsgD family transcriptional regulator
VSYIDDKTIEHVQSGLRRITKLTDRQREVLRLVSSGATNQQISRRLGIAGPTVENHIKDLKFRLDVDSRSLLAVIGYFELVASFFEEALASDLPLKHGDTLIMHHPSLSVVIPRLEQAA